MLDKLKAVVGSVVGLASVLIGRITAESTILPDLNPFDWKGWLLLAVSGLVGGAGVFGVPNTTTDPVVAANQSVRLKPGRHALHGDIGG